MTSLTVRLPDRLVTEIEAEARARNCTKSDVVRQRLERGAGPRPHSSTRLNHVADLIGSVDGLPADTSGRKKKYLKTTSYGKQRGR